MNKGTVVIIGDSWAESMWRIESIDTLINRHIHGILEQHGYMVYNFGIIGGSNLESWQSYESLLVKEEHPPDLVIWFHTEVVRDGKNKINDIIQHNEPWMLQDSISTVADASYNKIKNIIEKYSVDNIFLIEGQAPVVEPEFSKHIPSPVYTVKSWRNKILNMPDLPEADIIQDVNIFEYGQNLDSIDTKVQTLKNIKNIFDAMENSPLFPDNVHPGREAHEQLATEILDFMNKTNR